MVLKELYEFIYKLKTYDIDILEIKPRTFRLLKENEICTLYDLVFTPSDELLTKKGFGEMSLNDLNYGLSYFGVHVGIFTYLKTNLSYNPIEKYE